MGNTVKRLELSNIRMIDGNEQKYDTVIQDGVLMEWVGIGWIGVRDATPEDNEKYPVVIDE